MSDLRRWFPMTLGRSTRSFFDDDDYFMGMDRQMRAIQRDMDQMFAHFNRLMPYNQIEREGMSGALTSGSPWDLRQAEDTMAQNPVIKDKDGKEKMLMNFDVRAFKPEEISIKTKDGRYVEVQGKHEEESENGRILRHYHRMFTLPEGVDPKDMTSMLSPEGVLSITAPVTRPQPAIEQSQKRAEPKPIAISHE